MRNLEWHRRSISCFFAEQLRVQLFSQIFLGQCILFELDVLFGELSVAPAVDESCTRARGIPKDASSNAGMRTHTTIYRRCSGKAFIASLLCSHNNAL